MSTGRSTAACSGSGHPGDGLPVGKYSADEWSGALQVTCLFRQHLGRSARMTRCEPAAPGRVDERLAPDSGRPGCRVVARSAQNE